MNFKRFVSSPKKSSSPSDCSFDNVSEFLLRPKFFLMEFWKKINGNCRKKILKLFLWTRGKQTWRPGHNFPATVWKKIDQKAYKLLSNGEKKSDFLPRSFFQTALPGIYNVVSINMIVAVCWKPEVFVAKSESFENPNLLSNSNYTSKCAPGHVKGSFVRPTRIFFTINSMFSLSGRRNQKTKIWLIVNILSTSSCSFVFVKCIYKNVTENFLTKVTNNWFKSSWPAPKTDFFWQKKISPQTVFSGT